ncbi:MAG TPA: 5'/3'-nucleotidase SurE [Ignavibacteria bacterium]|nr:5'/3'-nucleotidase SurE [Ignavibacteria bacterium]HRJ98808.1 5'/3'-nucleotidase SurE [Ignavibacteria bacterium]
MKKPTVLISNDDGIESEGIKALWREIRKFAEVIVVAPNTQQSAVGHSITVSNPIRVNKNLIDKNFYGYAVEGSPADSVKLAIRNLLKGKKIDLLLSGINHGANTAINIIYSGTVSAATEGTILGIPSIAFSLASFTERDFSVSAKFASVISKMVLKKGLPKGTLLNVNIPAIPAGKIKGVLVTRQGRSYWDDYYDSRIDPNKREYFWLTGKMASLDKSVEFDQKAMEDGYITVTPIQYDLTDYKMLDELKGWNLKL